MCGRTVCIDFITVLDCVLKISHTHFVRWLKNFSLIERYYMFGRKARVNKYYIFWIIWKISHAQFVGWLKKFFC